MIAICLQGSPQEKLRGVVWVEFVATSHISITHGNIMDTEGMRVSTLKVPRENTMIAKDHGSLLAMTELYRRYVVK